MGGQQSVQMSCTVNKLTHLPGEIVKGSVHIQVQTPLTQFEGVTIALAGVECIGGGGSTSDGGSDGSDNARVQVGRKINIRQDIVIFPDGILKEGEYEFPFELTLSHFDTNNNKKKNNHGFHPNNNNNNNRIPLVDPDYYDDDTENDDDDLPDLIHSRNNSEGTVSSKYSTTSTLDYKMLTIRPILYQLRASLKRKKGVPLTIDTDYKCQARCLE
eukprot:scaffold24_cov128-Cylindrotheca_fusiformis.AAC.18